MHFAEGKAVVNATDFEIQSLRLKITDPRRSRENLNNVNHVIHIAYKVIDVKLFTSELIDRVV